MIMSALAEAMLNDEILPPLLSLVKEAGLAIMAIYKPYKAGDTLDVGAITKADASPLTAADLVAHQVIQAGLRLLTPYIPVISEEDDESSLDRSRLSTFWLVDPLDGTKEFLARNDEFTVNIALIENGSPVWGVVEGAGGFVVGTAGNPLVYGMPDVLNPSFIVTSAPLRQLVSHD